MLAVDDFEFLEGLKTWSQAISAETGVIITRMMKITFSNGCESAVLKLEGRLAGPWVDELEKTWHAAAPASTASHLVLDLCEVTFVDAGGRKLLGEMHDAGVELVGEGIMTQYMIEAIKHGHNGHKNKGQQGGGAKGSDAKVTMA
jgi:anti-anti-sigma regulatory factor